MGYDEVVTYLYSQLPMFQRIGAAAYRANLDNALALARITGHPENTFKSVHVAGTNGKGSVSHLIASVLQASGYKTGLFTSPHLQDFRERIRINGEMISREAVADFVNAHRSAWEGEGLHPSFFEMTSAMAFHCFSSEKVDIAVIETGMGGRLDSTNIITPELSVITNVSFDHQQFLGPTIARIAAEKAGIVKPGRPLVLGPMVGEAEKVCREVAWAMGSSVVHAASTCDEAPETPLFGDFQQENRCTAYAALKTLASLGWKGIREESIKIGFASVRENTGLRGRWEVLGSAPLIVADCGHNEAGMAAVTEELKRIVYRDLHMVIGMSADKDHDAVLRLLPAIATYYFCKPDLPRGWNAEDLRERAAHFGLRGLAYKSVADAFEAARQVAGNQDMIFIGGSFFVVAEIL